MTLSEARAARRENRRKMKTASPTCLAILEKLDVLYGELIEVLKCRTRT